MCKKGPASKMRIQEFEFNYWFGTAKINRSFYLVTTWCMPRSIRERAQSEADAVWGGTGPKSTHFRTS